MRIVDVRNGKILSMQTKEMQNIKISGLAAKILASLGKKPGYPKELSKRLGVHEQKVYYHMRNLEKAGMIRVLKKEEHGGTLAKIYELTEPSFFVKFKDFTTSRKIDIAENDFLKPFVSSGRLNCKIVVGSPDPHGPERARSRDASYAIDLGIFLGTFIDSSRPSMILDTELHDMKKNLIVIGGPVINRVARMINEKMPVRFDEKKNIYSSLTKKTYKSDDAGLIVKAKNPFSKEHSILYIAGKRYSGTRAAILAFLKCFDDISKKNNHVVEGIDEDGDGIIDDVRMVE
jgi:DNA-binding transcriptional ArsR family regulator